MPSQVLMVGIAVLASLVAAGCDQVTQGQTDFQAGEWATYTSPDKHVSFDYPSSLKLTVRPRQAESDPHLALVMVSPDESIGLTLTLRISSEPLPGYCEHMMASCLDANTAAITKCEPISLGGGQGFRQEFRSGSGWLANEFVAVALEAQPAYVVFTCDSKVRNRQQLQPICERIVQSLRLHSP
jgi:hypothetical protein